MRSLRLLSHLFSTKRILIRNLNVYTSICTLKNSFSKNERNQHISKPNYVKQVHSGNDLLDFDDSEALLEAEQLEKMDFVKNLLFIDSKDEIIIKLNNSASLEDVMNVFDQYEKVFLPEHMTQMILVLRDLQNGFYCYNGFNKKSLAEFNNILQNTNGFKKLVNIIKNNLDYFNTKLLSYLFFYINKLGLCVEDDLMQDIALRLRIDLRKDFNLSVCAKFVSVIFHERSVRPFNLSVEFLPNILSAIGKFLVNSL